MTESVSFHAAVDVTGILGLVFMLLSFLNRQAVQLPKTRQLVVVFVNMIFILLSDLFLCRHLGMPQFQTMLYASSSAYLALSYMMLLALLRYMQLDGIYINPFWRKAQILLYITTFAMMLVSLTNPLHQKILSFDALGQIYFGSWRSLLSLHSGIVMAIVVAFLTTQRHLPWVSRFGMAFYTCLPLSASILSSIAPQYFVPNMAALFSALIIFAMHFQEQSLTAAASEVELETARAALVLAQIQPHFLFNSMATVMHLCDTDPQEAKESLQELSNYLHYKISAMSHSYMVDFAEDLEFVQNYLKLEKRRYGSRLNVEFDIGFSDFQIPLLTLQPLVENAIRHGISKKPDGGTIRITTQKTGRTILLTIEDDGVGFDVRQNYENDLKHFGLSSVRRRLQVLCSGNLKMESTPGKGARIIITVEERSAP